MIGKVNDDWIQEPPQFRVERTAGSSLNDALRAGQMNAELLKLGLEPTKQAYEQKIAELRAAEKQNESKAPNWISRIFLGKEQKKSSLQAMATKPCVGDNCPTPKPCQGKTCRPAPPPCKGKKCLPPPGACVIADGSPGSGCTPWGYIERCDDSEGACYAHLARANAADCEEIRLRLEQKETRASFLQTAQQTACSSGAQTAQCTSAMADYGRAQIAIDQLRKQYQLCLMAENP